MIENADRVPSPSNWTDHYPITTKSTPSHTHTRFETFDHSSRFLISNRRKWFTYRCISSFAPNYQLLFLKKSVFLLNFTLLLQNWKLNLKFYINLNLMMDQKGFPSTKNSRSGHSTRGFVLICNFSLSSAT